MNAMNSSYAQKEELRATQRLPQPVYDYYVGAAGDERTVKDNIRAFQSIFFVPRCFHTQAKVDTTIFLPDIGTLPVPVLIAPMAMQKLAHPDGEIAVARAAHSLNIPYILSTFSTTSIENVASTIESPLLFQLYLYKDREVSKSLLQRARKARCKAVVLTVDAARVGRRERDVSSKLSLPPHLSLANFPDGAALKEGVHWMSDVFPNKVEQVLTPAAIKWVVKNAGIPVWVKGILSPDDALEAINMGVSAIVVSNHGGRQLEGALPTLMALPPVVAAVNGRVPVLVDSGVRSGEDVVRALALGASAVLLGRPVLWALANGGQNGVADLFKRFIYDVDRTMALCGVTSVEQITKDLVVTNWFNKL